MNNGRKRGPCSVSTGLIRRGTAARPNQCEADPFGRSTGPLVGEGRGDVRGLAARNRRSAVSPVGGVQGRPQPLLVQGAGQNAVTRAVRSEQ